MVEINVSDLKNEIVELNSIINDYEEVYLNLFNQLKNSCINWQDGNSVVFDDAIQIEKRETEDVLKSFKNKKQIYDYLFTKYNEIGHKVKCNLNNKSGVIQTIESCKYQVISLINEFNYIDTSFYYPEQYSIFQQRDRIVGVRNSLETLKNDVNQLFKKIENIENTVSGKIKKLEQIRINSFDYKLGTGAGSAQAGTVNDSLFANDIAQIKYYSDEENRVIEKTKKKMQDCNKTYKSTNTQLMENSVGEITVTKNDLKAKREQYTVVLDQVVDLYSKMTKETKSAFEKED